MFFLQWLETKDIALDKNVLPLDLWRWQRCLSLFCFYGMSLTSLCSVSRDISPSFNSFLIIFWLFFPMLLHRGEIQNLQFNPWKHAHHDETIRIISVYFQETCGALVISDGVFHLLWKSDNFHQISIICIVPPAGFIFSYR